MNLSNKKGLFYSLVLRRKKQISLTPSLAFPFRLINRKCSRSKIPAFFLRHSPPENPATTNRNFPMNTCGENKSMYNKKEYKTQEDRREK